jgi:bifunctional non-homologous end joining protein LigD
VWSRRAADFTDRFQRIADAVRGLPVDQAQDDGRGDFHALLTKRGWLIAAFVAIDLLRLDGDDLRQRPLEARREALMRLIAKRRGDGILFSEALVEEGAVGCSPKRASWASKASCRSWRAAFIGAG